MTHNCLQSIDERSSPSKVVCLEDIQERERFQITADIANGSPMNKDDTNMKSLFVG